MPPPTEELTRLLQRVAGGDAEAREPLYELLYPELLRIARSHLGRAGTISLDVTALLAEAWLRLATGHELPSANRRLFFAYASKVMRSVLVDYVRERGALKRGGAATQVTLSGVADELLADRSFADLEAALAALAEVDERALRVVEMRYFAGMTEEDIAGVLSISPATVRRDWRKARAFLYERLR